MLLLAIGLVLGCAGGTGVPELDRVLASARAASGTSGPLDESTVIAGLRDALRVGTDRTVASTSRLDGYLGNELIRIHAPESLDTMTRALRAVGFGGKVHGRRRILGGGDRVRPRADAVTVGK